MSGKLVQEVLNHAPDDLTSAQMLVLVSLAEDARGEQRIARYHTSVVELHHRTRLAPGTVKNALGQLVRRGLITPTHRARIGVVQHYRLTHLEPHHRAATIYPREPTP